LAHAKQRMLEETKWSADWESMDRNRPAGQSHAAMTKTLRTAFDWLPSSPLALESSKRGREVYEARLSALHNPCPQGVSCAHLADLVASQYTPPSLPTYVSCWQSLCQHYHPFSQVQEVCTEHVRKQKVKAELIHDQIWNWVGPESVYRDRWLIWLHKDWFQVYVNQQFVSPLWALVREYFHGTNRYITQWDACIATGEAQVLPYSAEDAKCGLVRFRMSSETCFARRFMVWEKEQKRRCIEREADQRGDLRFVPPTQGVATPARFCSEECLALVTHTADYRKVIKCDGKGPYCAQRVKNEPLSPFDPVKEGFVHKPHRDCGGPADCPDYFKEEWTVGCPGCNHIRYRGLCPQPDEFQSFSNGVFNVTTGHFSPFDADTLLAMARGMRSVTERINGK